MNMITLRPKIPTLGTGQLYLVNKYRVHMLNAAERRHVIITALVILALVAVAVLIYFGVIPTPTDLLNP